MTGIIELLAKKITDFDKLSPNVDFISPFTLSPAAWLRTGLMKGIFFLQSKAFDCERRTRTRTTLGIAGNAVYFRWWPCDD